MTDDDEIVSEKEKSDKQTATLKIQTMMKFRLNNNEQSIVLRQNLKFRKQKYACLES